MILIKEIEGRRNKHGKTYRYGIFKCEFCKKEFEKPFAAKRYKSCGCARGIHAVTHYLTNTKLYHTWEGMKARCNNKNHDSYKYYGAKGISVCDKWSNSFEEFASWAFRNGFKKDLQIDRKDSNGDYSPENCQFITNKENIRKRPNTKLTKEKANEIRDLYKTSKYTQKELATIYKSSPSVVNRIINNSLWL